MFGKKFFLSLDGFLFAFAVLGLAIFTTFYLRATPGAAQSNNGTNRVKIAEVLESKGAASIRRANDWTWFPLKEGDELADGDSLRTSEGARIVFQFSGENIFRVEPSSFMVLRQQNGESRIELKIGELVPEVTDNKSIKVDVDSNRGAKVAKALKVVDGTASPAELEAALILGEPVDGKIIGVSDDAPTGILVTWMSRRGGPFQVQIARDSTFSNVLKTVISDAKRVEVPLESEKARGQLFVRVKHVETGSFSAVHSVVGYNLSVPENLRPDGSTIASASDGFVWTSKSEITAAELEVVQEGRSWKIPLSTAAEAPKLGGIEGLRVQSPFRWRVRNARGPLVTAWSAWASVTPVEKPQAPVIVPDKNGFVLRWDRKKVSWGCPRPLEVGWLQSSQGNLRLDFSRDVGFSEFRSMVPSGSSPSAYCPDKPGMTYGRVAFAEVGQALRFSEATAFKVILEAPRLEGNILFRRGKGEISLPWEQTAWFGERVEIEYKELAASNIRKQTFQRPGEPLVLEGKKEFEARFRFAATDGQWMGAWGPFEKYFVRDGMESDVLGQSRGPAGMRAAPVYSTSKSAKLWMRVDWDAQNSANYQLQVSRDETFRRAEQTLSSQVNNAVLVLPESGRWFWRFRAQDAEGLWSSWSPAHQIEASRVPAGRRK